MTFHIKAVDTSGVISLHRDTADAAAKKATELLADGCWDVEIVTPEGQVIPAETLPQASAQTGA
ncbi:hypothetical protein HNR60_004218 [Rhodopseudomonas rhenobacensis]|uniref:Uncharacterized protein n=1 Tax=Rhodopseudomonas rhenobacensis TaxID=87461 RepID=A0A7W7Z7U8_9BRAD|nr:hypothetical protein [Rhodopseudomonas rhenobacensis]MBB5049440.1 hypothetical protein [Rhodopseudomonas rhenobacensis]